MDLVLNFLRDHPALLFAAIAILPGFAFPSAPLVILAGIVWGPTPTGCALALAAIGLNICWTHLLAAGPARKTLIRLIGPRLERLLNPTDTPDPSTWRGRLARSLPRSSNPEGALATQPSGRSPIPLDADNHPPPPRLQQAGRSRLTRHWKIVCALRLPPGIPLFVQNYGIALLGAPLRLSVAIAIPTTAVHVCGFVLTGGAILEGRIALLLLGITLLILATLLIHTLRKRFG